MTKELRSRSAKRVLIKNGKQLLVMIRLLKVTQLLPLRLPIRKKTLGGIMKTLLLFSLLLVFAACTGSNLGTDDNSNNQNNDDQDDDQNIVTPTDCEIPSANTYYVKVSGNNSTGTGSINC